MTAFVHIYVQMNAVRILQEKFGVGWLAGVVNGVVINVRDKATHLYDACGINRPF